MLCAASAGLGYHKGYSSADDKHTLANNAAKIKEQEQVIGVQEAFREEEGRRSTIVEEVENAQGKKSAERNTDIVADDAVAKRLFEQLEKTRISYRSSLATCDARIAQQRETGRNTIDLLTELYQEADREAATLAAELERARNAGLACEAVYDGIRNKK